MGIKNTMCGDKAEVPEMEKVVKLTVMVSEEQAARLTLAQQKTGANASELVRFSLDHSIPIAIAYPSLVHIVPTIPPQTNQK